MRFIALLASHLEAAGCEVQHESADGDRLFILMALGVADEGGASTLSDPEKQFVNTNTGKLRPSISTETWPWGVHRELR